MSSLNRTVSRSEVSLVNPSGEPKTFKFGSVPCSVIYMLPIENDELRNPFLTALREAFLKGQGLGLVFKKDDTHFIFELALPSKKECKVAFDVPVKVYYEEQAYTFNAFEVVSGSLDLFRVNLSGITLKDHKYIKTQLLHMFCVYDSILDIVLYEDDPTGSWFTGNGYVVVARDRKYRKEKKRTLFYLDDYPLRQRIYAAWTQLNDPISNEVASDDSSNCEKSDDCGMYSD
ncbi:hypothetical protein HPULCUR_002431 [Helicostylum pulchrum]|uniref:Uncharacterized protein n=1 Tax=Helicostylum pulchrum TaxID=562976 RepID=A0ABP9XQM6_9FUNG